MWCILSTVVTCDNETSGRTFPCKSLSLKCVDSIMVLTTRDPTLSLQNFCKFIASAAAVGANIATRSPFCICMQTLFCIFQFCMVL